MFNSKLYLLIIVLVIIILYIYFNSKQNKQNTTKVGFVYESVLDDIHIPLLNDTISIKSDFSSTSINFILDQYRNKNITKFILNIPSFQLKRIIDFFKQRPEYNNLLFICTTSTSTFLRSEAPSNFLFTITSNDIFIPESFDIVAASTNNKIISLVYDDKDDKAFFSEIIKTSKDLGYDTYIYPEQFEEYLEKINDLEYQNYATLISLPEQSLYEEFATSVSTKSKNYIGPIFFVDFKPKSLTISNILDNKMYTIFADVSYKTNILNNLDPVKNSCIPIANSVDKWDKLISSNIFSKGLTSFGITVEEYE